MKLTEKKIEQAEKLDKLMDKGATLNRKQRRFHSATLAKIMKDDG